MPIDLLAERTKKQPRDLLEQSAAASGWSPASEADLAEKVGGTGTFADMTGSGMAKAVPFGDEIVSGVNAPFRAAREWMQGDGFDIGRAYDRNMQVEAELQRRREDRSPIASTVGSVVGAVGASSPLVKGGISFLQGAKPTLGSLVGRGAAEGAAYGAAYGAGEGRGLAERGHNALIGSVAGGVAGGAAGGIARLGAGKVDGQLAPRAEQLRKMGEQAYQRADQAGVVFAPEAMQKLSKDLTAEFAQFGFHPRLQPGAATVLREIEKQTQTPVTLKGLDTIRKMASNAYDPANKANNALVSKIVDKIDNLVSSPAAGEVMMGDAKIGAEALKQARQVWSRLSKLERVQGAITRAETRAASTGSGGNVDNAIRQNLRRILDNPRGFTQEEIKALEAVVKGTKGQNALRLLGKLSPQGNGLMAALGIGGTMLNPAVGAASLAGMGAKAAADGLTKQNAALLQAIIRSGGQLPLQALTPARIAITGAAARSGAQQLPGYIGR